VAYRLPRLSFSSLIEDSLKPPFRIAPAAMIGVGVRVDDRIQTPSVIREDCEVALDLVA
jgi:hypothetical protein